MFFGGSLQFSQAPQSCWTPSRGSKLCKGHGSYDSGALRHRSQRLRLRMPQMSAEGQAAQPSGVKELIEEALYLELHATIEQAIGLLEDALAGASDAYQAAEVHFHIARLLALLPGPDGRRVKGSQYHFHRAMTLRPEWIPFDSRLATDETINNVLRCFEDDTPSCLEVSRGRAQDVATVRQVDQAQGRACRHLCDPCRTCSNPLRNLIISHRTLIDLLTLIVLWQSLVRHSYTASTVQTLFGYGGPPTPGPFYLRKRIDHRAAGALPSNEPRSALDVLVRLFLLGVTVDADLAASLLGASCVLAMYRLQLINTCPLDSGQLHSFVQIYPLSLAPALQSARMMDDGLRIGDGGVGVGSDDVSDEVAGMGNDLFIATDWAPPVSCTLEEEPVMYLGADSLGLVRMASIARYLSLAPPRDQGQPAQGDADLGHECDEHADDSTEGGRTQRARRRRRRRERVLDLCTGSGVQGIAMARLSELLGGRAEVTCVDINPRAVRFARFNAALNEMPAMNGEGEEGEEGEEGGALSRVKVRLGDLYAAVKRGVGDTKGPQQEEDETKFDVILANPPFVPVPGSLNREVKRYDLFADGGEGGEDVLANIVKGLAGNLRSSPEAQRWGPQWGGGGGWLCLVTELCNPRDFPTKIRGWMCCEDGVGTGNMGKAREGDSRIGWRALVFHDDVPHEYSVEGYCRVRAGSVSERFTWHAHLDSQNISSVARGYLFVQLEEQGQAGGREESVGQAGEASSSARGRTEPRDAYQPRDKDVEPPDIPLSDKEQRQGSAAGMSISRIVGWGEELSTWAPMNDAAADAFARNLSMLARVRLERCD
jgi:methylase of polypeptide subunit release factors